MSGQPESMPAPPPAETPPTFAEANELPGPPLRPSEHRARALFERECRSCHGADGGEGRPAFADPAWRREQTPADVFAAIRQGPHHVFGARERLGLQEAWDVTTFVWACGRKPADVEEGRRLFALHCADCHGAAGDGIGAAIEERPPSWSDFSLAGTLATDSDADLEGVVAHGLPEFGMPGFDERLDASQRTTLVGFLRALPFAEVYLASGAGRSASWRSPRLGPSSAAPAATVVWVGLALVLLGGVAMALRRRR